MAAELNENHRRVRVPQGSICYREFGTGAPVVFVHGLMVNGALWRKFVACPTSGRRISLLLGSNC